MLIPALALCLAAQDVFTQQAYVKSSHTVFGDEFGYAVAIDGDTLVVGAYREDVHSLGVNDFPSGLSSPNSGAVFVFVRHGLGWVQQAYIKASNTGADDRFGFAVDIDGDVLVVGAPEEDGGATGVNGNEADNSAWLAGAAYVFVRNGTTWTQQAYLKASNAQSEDAFGRSVSVSGDTIVVGAFGEDSASTGVNGDGADNSAFSAGAAYVFVSDGGVWSQQAYLKASHVQSSDYFGDAVAISGDTVAVGARFKFTGPLGLPWGFGVVFVYTRTAGMWSEQTLISPSDRGSQDWFGASLDVDGDTLVVGAPREDSAASGVDGVQADDSLQDAGAAYVFVRNAGVWSQQAYLKSSAPDVLDLFGGSVAISGERIVVGARDEDSAAIGIDGDDTDDSAADAGAAYVFTRTGSVWSPHTYLKSSNTDAGDEFGTSVSVSGDTIVCGAAFEDGAAVGVDGDESSNGASGAGAAYVFTDHHWGTIRGCLVNPAKIAEPTSDAAIGTTVEFEVHSFALTSGIAATYWGVKSIDANGCGALLSPTEELLVALAPAPTLLTYAPLVGGIATSAFVVPYNPALIGIEVTLQAAIVDTLTFASEISQAVEFEIRP